MSEFFLEYVRELIPESDIKLYEPMSAHITFRVGGVADIFITPSSKKELCTLIKYLNLVERDYFVLGQGSNLLVGDHGYRGVIVHIGKKFSDIRVEENRIRAGAGALLSKIAAEAAEHSLTGFEFAAGIPGTAGGAIVMNAGAYGREMSDIVESVETVTTDGEYLVLKASELGFGYRKSIIRDEKLLVTEVTFRLEEGDKASIRKRMEELQNKRMEKQPLKFPSAGSTFKRPDGYFAGKLIMDAGLSGYRIGGAAVSEKHCGFIINIGNASAADILDVIGDVQDKVLERFNVALEPEICIIGDF
ncbi:MAG: UDP-N-acetylmuramate dehydrogenase [Lachnospiraceae bacterium]|nr:UDP-N-acetylmuramate dehydrogenase [Lachnospiraceae bacterium]